MNLRQCRKNVGLTQKEVSLALNLTPNAYGHYETGRSEPNIQMLKALSRLFHTTIDNLVGNDVNAFLLDKSSLTEKQRQIVDLLPEMSDRICEKAEAYISGLIAGEQDRKTNVQKWTS